MSKLRTWRIRELKAARHLHLVCPTEPRTGKLRYIKQPNIESSINFTILVAPLFQSRTRRLLTRDVVYPKTELR